MPRYQLSLVAEKLPRGFFRRPNPYAKVYVSGGPREGEIIGQTEVIQDAQSADWVNTFFIETDPSIFLPLKVSIYDDRNDTLLTEQVFEATEVNSNPGHVQENKASNGARFVIFDSHRSRNFLVQRIQQHIHGNVCWEALHNHL